MSGPGRNDPCPCGSGKKYKKCCLPKDRARRIERLEERRTEEAAPEEGSAPREPLVSSFGAEIGLEEADIHPNLPEVDPLVERMNDLWRTYEEADYQTKWEVIGDTLENEPELLDGEMLLDMSEALVRPVYQTGELERLLALLDRIEAERPEAYEEYLSYFLTIRLKIGLARGDDDAVERDFMRFAPLAGDDLDNYYRAASGLKYHNYLDLVYRGMRRAWPYVQESEDLFTWAAQRFASRLLDVEVLYWLEREPDLHLDHPTLQAHIGEYDLELDEEYARRLLDYQTGRRKPAWSLDDFRISSSDDEPDSLANLSCLIKAFLHDVSRDGSMPVTRADLGTSELYVYFVKRQRGELGPITRVSRGETSWKEGWHLLVPDAQTLDRYLGEMGFFTFQVHEATALFEVIPPWLHFLAEYDLLEEKLVEKVLEPLAYLKETLTTMAERSMADAAVKENLAAWPE